MIVIAVTYESYSEGNPVRRYDRTSSSRGAASAAAISDARFLIFPK
jgi:hypothetical protein